MGWVIVIESDPARLDDVKDALVQVDPKAEVVAFADSHAFLAWMQKLQDQDPKIEPPRPADQFLGLVTALDSWKFKDLKLIGKFKALFIQKGFAKAEDEIFVIFTTYDSPGFQKRRFEFKSVNNVIFKPFDKLVLSQALDAAAKGRVAMKNRFSHTQKVPAEIEMLKEAKMTAIGEAGFQTESAQDLPVGAIAKYYATFLETRQHRSALAQVLSFSREPGAETGHGELKYFALDQTQSFNIQKIAQTERKLRTLAPSEVDPSTFEFYFVKSESSPLGTEIQPSIERFFDHPVSSFNSSEELGKHLSEATATPKKRFVFIDIAIIAGDELKQIETLLATNAEKNLAVCLLCSRILPEALERSLSAVCEDVYYAPFNRSYIVKSMKLKWPELRNREEIFEYRHETEQVIHVSNPVQIVEISEMGLLMDYHRAIHLGSFREFHLPLDNENEMVAITAQCNFTEPTADKKAVRCHFVFFGLRDHELKFVRRWMLNQYVEEKQKASQ